MPLGGGGAGGGTGGLLDDVVGGDCGMFLIIKTYDAASLLQLRIRRLTPRILDTVQGFDIEEQRKQVVNFGTYIRRPSATRNH
jgi:hypothetical protein